MSSSIRFSGLASGLDTQSMVKALAQPYQNKVDQAKQDKTMMEWRKDAYKQINSKILSFNNKYIANMRLETTFNKTKVAVSNPGIISMDSNVPVPPGNHIIEVKKMASGAVVSTSSRTSDAMQDGQFSMEVNGVSISVDATGKTCKEFEKAVNDALTDAKVTDINFKFDESSKAFIVNSTKSGNDQTIKMDENSLNILNGKPQNPPDPLGKPVPIHTFSGSDAEILYNGGIKVTSTTNSIEVNGLKLNITGTSTEPITISSVKDTDAIVNFAKEFVEEYNNLMDEINTLVSADSAKGYKPLTDEQRESMSDKEIELWEKKIKDSLLKNDPILKQVSSMMRNATGKKYDGIKNEKYDTLSEIGIATGNWSERGKLHLDEEKLRKAINDDSNAVAKLFTEVGKEIYGEPGGSGKEATGFQAMLKSNDLKSYGQLFNDKLLDQNMRKMSETIKKAEAKYTRIENMYYKQFTAMEKMLNSLNSQSAWLSGGM